MFSRIAFLLVTLFWVTMNFLLWRSEFGGHQRAGSTVPVEMVWQKILTAPDNSSLEIRHHGQRVGYCQWAANIGQEPPAAKVITDEAPPEMTANGRSGYRIDFEGNLALGERANHFRFDLALKLATNHVWQDLNARVNFHPSILEVHAVAARETVQLKMESPGEKWERTYKLADLQNPQALAGEFGMVLPSGLLDTMGLSGKTQAGAPLSLGLTWEARTDWITIGHTSVRAYRLQARLIDRYRMIIIVSRVGEILRVELPDEWTLMNDQLTSL